MTAQRRRPIIKPMRREILDARPPDAFDLTVALRTASVPTARTSDQSTTSNPLDERERHESNSLVQHTLALPRPLDMDRARSIVPRVAEVAAIVIRALELELEIRPLAGPVLAVVQRDVADVFGLPGCFFFQGGRDGFFVCVCVFYCCEGAKLGVGECEGGVRVWV